MKEKNGTLILTLNGHSSSVLALKILPNGDYVSGSADTTIKIWFLIKILTMNMNR
jgi:WD40 repeat protein